MAKPAWNPATHPNADNVALAIILAARETGADPLAVAAGDANPKVPGVFRAVTRARCYAALALRAEFPEANKSALARMVGASKAVAGAYFSSKDQQRKEGDLAWLKVGVIQIIHNALACQRGGVLRALPVMPNEARVELSTPAVAEPVAKQPVAPKVEESRDGLGKTLPPAKPKPEPPPYRGGVEFRPKPGTVQRVLADDAADDADQGAVSVFDKGAFGRERRYYDPLASRDSKAQMHDDLAEAVRRTAAMTPPPEEGDDV